MMKKCIWVVACGLVAVASATAQSQPWPAKPVKWLVGYAAGGGVDTMARVLSEPMSRGLGQPVVIENRPGATGMIAAEALARSASDGYTIMIADNGVLVNNPALFKKISYDPVNDYAPLTLLGRFIFVLVVSPSSGFKNFEDLRQKVAAAPDKYTYASSGAGTALHLGMEAIKAQTGLSITHVPYKGTAPAELDLMGGRVDMMLAPLGIVLPHIKSNKLIPIAALTSKRIPQLPEVQTLHEQGVTGNFSGWLAVVVPAKTPDDVKAKLGSALKEAMAAPATIQRFNELAIEPVNSTPAELAAFQQMETERWHKFIKEKGISID